MIVPFRGVLPYLDRCIDSLLNQTLPRKTFEILFIDNNSSDGGGVAARPEVRWLREPRPGAYAARNRGLQEARGEILAFTDPDCEVARDWLERITAAMRAPEVGIVLGRRVGATDRRLLSLVMAYESQKAAYVTSRDIAELFFGHTNNMAVQRHVMERVGPFVDRARGSDTILVRRAVDAYGCGIARYCPEIEVRHLEVATLSSYYRKARIYGQSNEGVVDLVRYRPLNAGERWQVLKDTVRHNRWSPMWGALLLALLVPGMLCYEWGRRIARARGNRGASVPAGDL